MFYTLKGVIAACLSIVGALVVVSTLMGSPSVFVQITWVSVAVLFAWLWALGGT